MNSAQDPRPGAIRVFVVPAEDFVTIPHKVSVRLTRLASLSLRSQGANAMKCPKCQSEQPPTERGPYKTRFAGLVVYMACPVCDTGWGFLPAVDDPADDDEREATTETNERGMTAPVSSRARPIW